MTSMESWRHLRLRRLDAALLVAVVVVASMTALAVASSWGDAYWATGPLFTLPVIVTLLARRNHELGASLVGLSWALGVTMLSAAQDLPAEPSPAMALALAVLTASAARHLDVRLAAAVLSLGLLVVLASTAGHPGSGATVPITTVFNGACWLAAVGAGIALRLNDDRAVLTGRRVRQETQLDLARELHDSVAHHITAIRVQAQAGHLLAQDDPVVATRLFADIEEASAQSLTAIRQVLGMLREDGTVARQHVTAATIEALADKLFVGRCIDVALNVDHSLLESGLSAPESNALFRIAQEALTNVARHAPSARHVVVRVSADLDQTRIEVTNDGVKGIAQRGSGPRSGFGLLGMHERARTLGGVVHAAPRPPDAWSVVAFIPRRRKVH